MPSYMPGELIKKIRERKRWQQSKLLNNGAVTDASLSRIENHRQQPGDYTFRSLMAELKISSDQFFCPYLENQTMDVYILRDQLLNYLDSVDEERFWIRDVEAINQGYVQKTKLNGVNFRSEQLTAEKLIKQLESRGGFDCGINLQFILSCKARLYDVQGADTSIIINIINEGLAVTFPEFDENTFADEMLIFEEIELLHTMAWVYNRLGNLPRAINLLIGIQKGLTILPEDDQEKERKLAKILLTLAKFLIEAKEYKKALDICEIGNTASIKWKHGKYTPYFLYNKAYCLLQLDRSEDCLSLLHQVYFAYTMLYKKKQSEQVLENAMKIFGLKINTYGSEKLDYDYPFTFSPISYGEPVTCKDIGMLIAILRTKANMTQKKLCQGICSVSNLCKIESGEIQAQVYFLEAFMQRLGRDINQYLNTFLSAQEFENKQLRNEINVLLSIRRYKEAEELLKILEMKKSFRSGVNQQFIQSAKASIVSSKEGFGQKYLDMALDALKITRPDFKEDMIEHYRLSYYEVVLINKIAICLTNTGERSRAIKIFDKLKESMDRFYVDEREKIRMYTTVLYNLSKNLGLMERYKEALEVISEGEALCIKHERISLLPGFIVNKACNLLGMGKKEESVPYFAQAYYGSQMIGNTQNQMVTKDYVKEHLGIVFD